MARSSKKDPLEKFRFRVTVISLDLSVTGVVETIGGLSSTGTAASNIAILSRSGFSQVTLPKANVNTMTYRENIDNQRFSKIPGLVKYDPITLSRGVTENRNFYDWYRLVNEELALLTVAGELAQDAKFTPTQSGNFRRDVIIEVLDRSGEPIKGWYLFNAYPAAYTPGTSLDASADEKLIEELTLEYEFFLELEGGANGFANEMLKGAAILAAGALLDRFAPQLGGF
jgi:phage tail-like protein